MTERDDEMPVVDATTSAEPVTVAETVVTVETVETVETTVATGTDESTPAPTPDLTVESPAARGREGGPLVKTAASAVTVKLERFEGPLDLLLHLIKRDEIDIHDIPIAHITKQYLQYIELKRALDLEVAGEFLVMAATLMRIKAKMLLPVPKADDEEDEGDPREELVQRLIEYRLYKEASETLKSQEGLRRTLFERGMVPTEDDAGPLPLAPATLFDLLEALNRVLARRPERTVYEVRTEQYDIEDKMSLIARTVFEEGRLAFSTLILNARARMEVIVSFMALLELIKLGRVIVTQDANFADILIMPRLHQEGTDSDGSDESPIGG